MTPNRRHRASWIGMCAIVGVLSSPMAARAQTGAGTPQADALSTAVKASPELVKGLAKELDATPEQAAGAAGLLFGIAKSFLKPDDFAKVSKAVPGMNALLAAVPPDVAAASNPAAIAGAALTPGFASSAASASPSSSSSSSIPGMTMAAPGGMASAIGGLAKLGIKPEMMAKAIPYLSGYLKKKGGGGVGGLLGAVFGSMGK